SGPGIVGRSPALQRVLHLVESVATTDVAVLIRGETGTGKEVIAELIHRLSARHGALVKLNCTAIPTALLESELFGHERGAFTGAIARRIGRFELAHQGTLLLDEIGDSPLDPRPQLLRALAAREAPRIGGTPSIGRAVQLVLRRAVILSQGASLQLPPSQVPVRTAWSRPARGERFDDAVRQHLLEVLRETNGIVAGPRGAAARLGLKRTTLLSRM